MFAYATEIVHKAEEAAAAGKSPWPILRQLPLDDFGELLITMPDEALPALSATLPRMASDQVQRNWTGNCGAVLLRQTNAFCRIVAQEYSSLTRRGLDDARILDFGCGYGRIMRSMYRFAEPGNIFGCDPWDASIDLCREASLPSQVRLSEYLPDTLPFEGKFDLIYAFSVFTHLSERASRCCLRTLADYLDDRGVMVVTLRPVEYWLARSDQFSTEEIARLMAAHADAGFAFDPHRTRKPVDGDITFGETSMSVDYLARIDGRLKVRGIERSNDDPHQILVFLTRG